MENNPDESSNKNQIMEKQMEKQIKEQLTCHYCSLNVKNPILCGCCKTLFCSDCIKNWLSSHDYCVYCQKKITGKDLISVPFLEGLSKFYLNNEYSKNKNEYI